MIVKFLAEFREFIPVAKPFRDLEAGFDFSFICLGLDEVNTNKCRQLDAAGRGSAGIFAFLLELDNLVHVGLGGIIDLHVDGVQHFADVLYLLAYNSVRINLEEQ